MKPTIYTWIIIITGLITFLPLLVAQLAMIINPQSEKTKDLIIGKKEDWRDASHYKYSLAFAWADWIIIFPLLIIGIIGVLNNQLWAYVVWISLGMISIYFSIIFWVLEREYSIRSYGRPAYYTYFWGFFLYWGIGSTVYSFIQILNANYL